MLTEVCACVRVWIDTCMGVCILCMRQNSVCKELTKEALDGEAILLSLIQSSDNGM